MRNILIRPPTRPSGGAQTLARAMPGRAKLVRREPTPKQYKYVINWGNPNAFQTVAQCVFNKPEAIHVAINKLTAFQCLRDAGVRIPEFTTTDPGRRTGIYLARTSLRGSGGEGIVVVRKDQPLPRAPLYVKYVPKLREFRVHVAFGSVVFLQEKRRQREGEQTEDQKLIRNHDNGWVFCINDIQLNADLEANIKREAINAVAALRLDFGAVDLVLGKDDNQAYILEVNTAPGLESPGLIAAYTGAFLAKCPDSPARPIRIPPTRTKLRRR